MKRRDMLRGSAGAAILAALGTDRAMAAQAAPAHWRNFEVTTDVTLTAPDGPAQLWLPVIQTAGTYQKSNGLSWSATGAAVIEPDAHYKAGILHARWENDRAPQSLTLVERISTSERRRDTTAAPLSQAERAFWTAPTASVPTDGIVAQTAQHIVGSQRDPAAKLRALYAWVVANSWRDPATPGCGTGDIKAMLSSGKLGGKCADINSLLVGLCRASGLPARDVYGIRVGDSTLFKSLGKSGDISKAQHCRAEVYLEGTGWFAVDPADVRKAVLEEKLPVESAQIKALAIRLFGAWESNWVGYNSATDITLAGAPHQPNFDFLIYPCAMTTRAQLDCLDPDHFRYRITARELSS